MYMHEVEDLNMYDFKTCSRVFVRHALTNSFKTRLKR